MVLLRLWWTMVSGAAMLRAIVAAAAGQLGKHSRPGPAASFSQAFPTMVNESVKSEILM